MDKNIDSLLLFSTDLSKTKSFYDKLGFSTLLVKEEELQIKSGEFMLRIFDKEKLTIPVQLSGNDKEKAMFLYINVSDVDYYYDELLKKGLIPSSEPKDWPWGNREFVIKDPDAYLLVFYQKV